VRTPSRGATAYDTKGLKSDKCELGDVTDHLYRSVKQLKLTQINKSKRKLTGKKGFSGSN
jgi:hypothetical protein